MKAKAYSLVYRTLKASDPKDGSARALNQIICGLDVELAELALQRGGGVQAAQSAFREVNDKWVAICRLNPELNPQGYSIIFRQNHPDMAFYLRRH